VFADSSWFLVTDKVGQRCKGRLLVSADTRRVPRKGLGLGSVLTEYQFTSRRVERVFRELGRRQKGE